jgi:molybdate transport system substrate-binding protein
MPHTIRAAALAGLVLAPVLAPVAARAEEVSVMISGGFKSTYAALLPAFETQTGNHVTTRPGPSMGTTPDAIPQRLARGEPDDVLIMVGSALDGLIRDGAAQPGSKVDLALSPIGMAVKAGAPVPDISTVDKLKAVLLAARSVAYSDSASGVYIENELFKRLGIEAEMKTKARMIPATPVAEIVAKGEAELGFQQVAEILPVPGITFAGRLPAEVQRNTVFSAGIATKAQHPAAAHALIAYMASPAAAPVLGKMGLDPVEP